MNAIDSLRSALRTAGLDYAGPIHADGKLHRLKAGEDREPNSWYVLHADPPMAAAFGCWKRGIKETWCERDVRFMPPREQQRVREQWQRADEQRKQDEAERHAEARAKADEIHAQSAPASPAHAYLVAKGVKPHGDMREHDGRLALPLRDASGTLHSLQFIGHAGDKRFLSGGKVAGTFYTIPGPDTGPLVICEGYATGASINEATGHAVVCAMHCGNLLAVAQALRAKWPRREFIVATDNDQFTEGNPGLSNATEAANTIAAKLASPQFTDLTTKPTDFNDLQQLQGIAQVKTQIEAASHLKDSDENIIARLAALPPLEYERTRQAEAERMGISRIAILDAEVEKRRSKPNVDQSGFGQRITFDEIEPWEHPVNGDELLSKLHAEVLRFVITDDAEAIAAALFVLHTFAFDHAEISPILFITGPTKRCGKTVLLSLLSRLVNRPLAASSTSAAGLYRTVELHRPTVLIDEVDTFLSGNEELRGLLNSGHTRDAAFFITCAKVGDDYEPRRWSTWAPKVFSGIGRIADTIEDRAVIVKMRRKLPSQKTEKLRRRIQFTELRQQCVRFIADHSEAIRSADPAVPDTLNDRAADNWSVLFALADSCGPIWGARARQAAITLSGGDNESTGDGAQLLADIADCFNSANTDRFASKELCERLGRIEGRSWAEFGKNQCPISPNQLANMLREFGVSSRSVAIGDKRPKGYLWQDFADAFSRYLPTNAIPKRYFATSPANKGDSSLLTSATLPVRSVPENSLPTNAGGSGSGVAFPKLQIAQENTITPEHREEEFASADLL